MAEEQQLHGNEEAVHIAIMTHLLRSVKKENSAFDGCDVTELEDGHQVIINGKVDLAVLSYDVIAAAMWLYNFHEDFLQHLSKDFFEQRESGNE